MLERQIFSKFLRFVEARLSPGGEFGLHLTIGLALVATAAALFGDLAEDVVGRAAITVLDLQLANWFNAHAVEPLTGIMFVVSALHTGVWMVLMVLLLGWYFWRIGARYWLLALLVAVAGGSSLNVLLKYVFQRTRPVFDHPLLTLTSYSFPSGHTAAATLFYGLLASYIFIARRGWSVRLGTAAACVVMVLLVALSRVYLGAHYMSDVLAAMASSVAWLAITITAISTLRRRREGRVPFIKTV